MKALPIYSVTSVHTFLNFLIVSRLNITVSVVSHGHIELVSLFHDDIMKY